MLVGTLPPISHHLCALDRVVFSGVLVERHRRVGVRPKGQIWHYGHDPFCRQVTLLYVRVYQLARRTYTHVEVDTRKRRRVTQTTGRGGGERKDEDDGEGYNDRHADTIPELGSIVEDLHNFRSVETCRDPYVHSISNVFLFSCSLSNRHEQEILKNDQAIDLRIQGSAETEQQTRMIDKHIDS